MESVVMLFDSIGVFYQFAYTPHPTPHDFTFLWISRTAILSFHAAHKWHLAPTTHYLTNHAILDAERDQTAYNTLQEGVEHINQEIKAEDKITFVSARAKHIPESSYMHVVNQQLLRLLLIKLGYSSDTLKFTLTDALTYIEPPPHFITTKPKYTP